METGRRPSFIPWGSKARSAGWPSSSRRAIAPIWSCSGSWHPATSSVSRRCLAVYEKRYPRSNRSFEFRDRLKKLEKKRGWRRLFRFAAAVIVAVGGAGRLGPACVRARPVVREGRRSSARRSRGDGPKCSSGIRRSRCSGRPWAARPGRSATEWQVKAAGVQVANGTAPADWAHVWASSKTRRRTSGPPSTQVEAAQALSRHDERWKTVQAEALSLAALDDPAAPLRTIDAFLREYPETPRRVEALALARSLKDDLAKRRSAVERQFVDDLVTSENLPTVSLADQIERARQFLADHPQSAVREQVNSRLEMYLKRLDEHDIDQARDFSRKNPDAVRQPDRTVPGLPEGPRGRRAVRQRGDRGQGPILREWDVYAYRQAYDHFQAHPDDVAEVAQRLRDYLRDHADGRYAADAERYQEWWDKISVPGQYRVTLRRGEVEPKVGKYFAGGAPDLGVVIEVAGAVYGPSTVIRDSHRPVWDYTFPQPDHLEARRPGHRPDHRLRLVGERGVRAP